MYIYILCVYLCIEKKMLVDPSKYFLFFSISLSESIPSYYERQTILDLRDLRSGTQTKSESEFELESYRTCTSRVLPNRKEESGFQRKETLKCYFK